MKAKFLKFATLVHAAIPLLAYAQSVIESDVAVPVAPDTTVKHLRVTIGPDGSGHANQVPFSGGVSSQAGDTLMPLYDAMGATKYSGYFTPTVRRDGIPFPAQAYVKQFQFWYHDNAGDAGDTCSATFTMYDGTSVSGVASDVNAAESRNGGCTDAATAAVLTSTTNTPVSFTITGLPRDASSTWIVTVDLVPGGFDFYANGRTWIGYQYAYEPSGTPSTTTGPILMNNDSQGLPLGVPVTYDGGTYVFRHAPGLSSATHFRPDNNTCTSFTNGNPQATHAYGLWGCYSFSAILGGDWGTLGPVLDYLWVEVIDTRANTSSVVQVACLDDPPGYEGFVVFSLPLDQNRSFDVRVLPQYGYLGKRITPVLDFATMNLFELIGGDCTGDNVVNLFDLNASLGQFGQVGD